MSARKIAECQRIGGDMEPDRFHGTQAAQRAHLRAVEHRRAQRLVVGDRGAYAFLLVKGRNQLHRIEKARDG